MKILSILFIFSFLFISGCVEKEKGLNVSQDRNTETVKLIEQAKSDHELYKEGLEIRKNIAKKTGMSLEDVLKKDNMVGLHFQKRNRELMAQYGPGKVPIEIFHALKAKREDAYKALIDSDFKTEPNLNW